MKFSLFAHIERYDESVSHKQLLDELTEFTLMAEAGGMETIWIGEHHGMEYTVAPNPFINLAYLAAKTTTIRLGTGNIIAPFWHPIRLAGEAALCVEPGTGNDRSFRQDAGQAGRRQPRHHVSPSGPRRRQTDRQQLRSGHAAC